MVTRTSVVLETLGRLLMGANILKFNGIVHLVVGDVSVDSEGVCGDFVNFENLPVQSSKMLIRVEFVYVCS